MPVRHAIAKRRLFITGPFCEEVRFGVDDRGVYLGADVLKLEQLHGVVDLEAELDGWKDAVFSDRSLPQPDFDERDRAREHPRDVAGAVGKTKQAGLAPCKMSARVTLSAVGIVARAENAAVAIASEAQAPRRSVREMYSTARALP